MQLIAANVTNTTNDSVQSELGHVVGGALIAGGITAGIDYFYPKEAQNRAIIGFGISSAIGVVEQTIQYTRYGNGKGQLLDAAAHVLGAALGAWITDQFILSPVVEHSSINGDYVGFAFQYAY